MKKIIYFLFLILVIPFFMTTQAKAEDYREVFQQAAEALQRNDMETAITLYEKVIKLNPSFAPAYNNLGLLYREAGLDPVEVAWYFKSAIDIDPKFEDAYINLGKAYYVLNYFDLAERYTLKALELNPDSGQAKLSLGWIYLLGKTRPQDALALFKQIIDTSDNPAAYFGLGMAYFMVGESPRTLECITKLREMQQDNLALQLEELVRNYQNMPKTETRPTTIQEEGIGGKDPLSQQKGVRTGVSSQTNGPTQITVTGTIPVQLKGKLIVEPPQAPAQSQSGVLKR